MKKGKEKVLEKFQLEEKKILFQQHKSFPLKNGVSLLDQPVQLLGLRPCPRIRFESFLHKTYMQKMTIES